jgi:hypothetical protein
MTASCFPTLSHLLSPRAINDSADIGSPWLPVEMMHTLLGG